VKCPVNELQRLITNRCHVDYDPHYAKLCASFKRNRGIRQEEACIHETISTTIKEDLTAPFEFDENGQFILF